MSVRRILAVAVLLGAALSLTACNTVRGFGQDVTAAGETLSDTAEQTRENITE